MPYMGIQQPTLSRVILRKLGLTTYCLLGSASTTGRSLDLNPLKKRWPQGAFHLNTIPSLGHKEASEEMPNPKLKNIGIINKSSSAVKTILALSSDYVCT